MSQEVMGPGPGGDHLDHVRDAIGRWIRHHREFLGISQEAFRRRLRDRGVSVSQSTLSRWERGEALPPTHVLPALSRALGTTLQDYEELVSRARARRLVDLTGRDFEGLVGEGLEAAQAGRLQRAADCLEAALDLAALSDQAPSTDLRARAFLRLAWVSLRLWHLERARVCLRDLTSLPGLAPEPAFLGLVLRLELAHRYGDPVAAAAFARAIHEELPEGGSRPRAIGLSTLAAWHFAEERFSDVIGPGSEAASLWRELRDAVELARSLGMLARACSRQEDADGASRHLQEAISLARRHGAREVEAFLLRVRGHILVDRGDPPAAIQAFLDAAALARRLELPEDEFVSTWCAWKVAESGIREQLSRRLRRLLPSVSSWLPEARAFTATAGTAEDAEEDQR